MISLFKSVYFVPMVPDLIPSEKTAKGFLQSIIKAPLEEIGLMLADKVRLYRAKQQIQIALKAEEYVKKKSIKTKKISLKVLTPLLEHASLEEDESLQDKWAALLANTAAENTDYENPIYSFLLSQITKEDAEVFEIICSNCITSNAFGADGAIQGTITFTNGRALHTKELIKAYRYGSISIDNLLRLRLIKDAPNTQNMSSPVVVVSDLGFHFASAVGII